MDRMAPQTLEDFTIREGRLVGEDSTMRQAAAAAAAVDLGVPAAHPRSVVPSDPL
jgi:hypothetical protein